VTNLVFVSGDFSSGSTLLFTLFRKSGGFYTLYEPLHQKLPEYLVFPLQAYEHHFFVGNYFDEYKGFLQVKHLFDPAWGIRKYLRLRAEDEADDLYRYLAYLIGTAFGRSPRVMLKENRLTFRLGWLRNRFPQAKIIHIQRAKDEEWKSWVTRGQAFRNRADVGQFKPTYNGFNMSDWCDELTPFYPELAVGNFTTGYDRFSTLWELSRAEHLNYADLSVDYRALLEDFAPSMHTIGKCIDFEFDTDYLQQFVIQPQQQAPLRPRGATLAGRLGQLAYRVGRRYAMDRLKLEGRLRRG
jgi:hypothetical protein